MMAEGFSPLGQSPSEAGGRFMFFEGPSIEEGGGFAPLGQPSSEAGGRFMFFEGPTIEGSGRFAPLAILANH